MLSGAARHGRSRVTQVGELECSALRDQASAAGSRAGTQINDMIGAGEWCLHRCSTTTSVFPLAAADPKYPTA